MIWGCREKHRGRRLEGRTSRRIEQEVKRRKARKIFGTSICRSPIVSISSEEPTNPAMQSYILYSRGTTMPCIKNHALMYEKLLFT